MTCPVSMPLLIKSLYQPLIKRGSADQPWRTPTPKAPPYSPATLSWNSDKPRFGAMFSEAACFLGPYENGFLTDEDLPRCSDTVSAEGCSVSAEVLPVLEALGSFSVVTLSLTGFLGIAAGEMSSPIVLATGAPAIWQSVLDTVGSLGVGGLRSLTPVKGKT